MALEYIHTYLVHAGKRSEKDPEIGGATVPLSGKLFKMLNYVYDRSDGECQIDIIFNNRGVDGKQENPCRDLILGYIKNPDLLHGRKLAERLERVTTNRSGLGLFFLLKGREAHSHKVVISRFPADSGILAEEKQKALTVEFLERVFMKSATSYKAALYQDTSLSTGFWTGKAVDKQINNRVAPSSNYWIADFLDSEFSTTAAAGTRRLAIALRKAARKATDPAIKSEIAAAATLARAMKGRTTSIQEFAQHFGLSAAATRLVLDELPNQAIAEERFRFDNTEFSIQLAYRSVELDSGGILTAESQDFDSVFDREIIDPKEGRVRFSTEGKIVNEKLAKAK